MNQKGSFAGLALDPDLAAKVLDQPLADGKAEAGAAIAIEDRRVGLGEALEDPLARLGGDADAGVGNLAAQQHAAVAQRLSVRRHDDAARLGEFQRVGAEIEQHLAQVLLVADECRRRAGRDAEAKPERLAAGLRDQHGAGLGEQREEIEIDLREGHPPGLDAREVKDGLDLGEQRPTGVLHGPRHILLLAVELGFEQHRAHADHGVERRAQLVADAGQEQAFRAIGRFGLLLGARELADQHAGIERQDQEADHQPGGERGLVAPERRRQHHGREGGEAREHPDTEIFDAEAEAVAEDDPEIDGVEDRGQPVADMHLVGDEADVPAEGGEPPRHVDRGRDEDVQDNSDRAGGEDRHAEHRRSGQRLAGRDQVDRDDRGEDQPVEAHLVLGVRPPAQARTEPAGPGAGKLVRVRRIHRPHPPPCAARVTIGSARGRRSCPPAWNPHAAPATGRGRSGWLGRRP